MGIWGNKDKDKESIQPLTDNLFSTSGDGTTVSRDDEQPPVASDTPPIDTAVSETLTETPAVIETTPEATPVASPTPTIPVDSTPVSASNPGGKMTKDYGIWNSAVVDVLNGESLVRVTLDLPAENKDKVVVETSISKAAARLVDNVAGYILEAAKTVPVFGQTPTLAPVDATTGAEATVGTKTIWDYASIRVDGDLVEVTIDMPGDDWDEVIVRTSRPKAAARLVDNVAGFLLEESKNVKPFDGSEIV